VQDQHGACCRDAASGGAEHATKYFRLLFMQADENLHAARETRGRYPRERRAAGLGRRIVSGPALSLSTLCKCNSYFLSVRQIDRQGRRAPSIISSKFTGKLYVVDIEATPGLREIAERTLELRRLVA
jgi:hypothetical protein